MDIENKIVQLENYIRSGGTTPLSPQILAEVAQHGGQKSEIPWPQKNGWTLYGRSSCPYCQGALNLLKKRNAPLYFIDLETQHIDKQNLLNFLRMEVNPKNQLLKAHETVPLIFHNGQFIGGYSQLMKILQ